MIKACKEVIICAKERIKTYPFDIPKNLDNELYMREFIIDLAADYLFMKLSFGDRLFFLRTGQYKEKLKDLIRPHYQDDKKVFYWKDKGGPKYD